MRPRRRRRGTNRCTPSALSLSASACRPRRCAAGTSATALVRPNTAGVGIVSTARPTSPLSRRMHELIVEGASPRSAARTALDSGGRRAVTPAALLDAAFDLDVVTRGAPVARSSPAPLRRARYVGSTGTPAFDGHRGAGRRKGEGCIDVEHALSWTVSRSLQRLPDRRAGRPPPRSSWRARARDTQFLRWKRCGRRSVERGRDALMLGADVPRGAHHRCGPTQRAPGIDAVAVADRGHRRHPHGQRRLPHMRRSARRRPGWDAVIATASTHRDWIASALPSTSSREVGRPTSRGVRRWSRCTASRPMMSLRTRNCGSSWEGQST